MFIVWATHNILIFTTFHLKSIDRILEFVFAAKFGIDLLLALKPTDLFIKTHQKRPENFCSKVSRQYLSKTLYN